MKVFLLGLTISLGVCGSRAISLPIFRRDAPHSTFVNMSVVSSGSEEDFNFTNKVFFYSATVFVEGEPYTVSSGIFPLDSISHLTRLLGSTGHWFIRPVG